jgi:hypothetical protein
LALLLLALTPTAIAQRCAGEASFAVQECACTVRNRLDAGWSAHRVLEAYYAPDAHATPAQVATVAAVMAGDEACSADLYFMYSWADVAYLGLGDYTPALVVESNGKVIFFFPRWFKRTERHG